nr:putative disease resistance protein [Quercus suber]
MAEAIVSGVVQRLGNLLIQESNFLSGVSDQVEQLQTELKLMQCLLKDADARQDESHFVRQLVAEIRDLAYDADDIIATYALKVESRRGGGIKKVLKRYAYIIDEGTTVHKVGSEIPKIMTRISNLTTRLLAMGIRESTEGGRLSSLSEKEQKQRQTYSYLEHDPVGFDDHRNELVEFLLKEEEGKRIASICEERNEIRKLSDEHIVEKLRQVQCEKKCLVILDDIWHIEDWNRLCLREAFPESGSKILLTTRSRDVALHADPRGLLHELHCLNEAKSLELFKKIAISWREESIIQDGRSSSLNEREREKRHTFCHLEHDVVGFCQKGASPAATPMQLSLPHSATASASGDAASAATLVQPSMPHSVATHASELPRQALDQGRQVNQLQAEVGTDETQIEASNRIPEILPYVPELKKLKKCAISSKRQCSLSDICIETHSIVLKRVSKGCITSYYTSAVQLATSAATSALGDAASAATVVLPSMPHSAASRASELPKQALNQGRQVNQLLADVGTNETQIEASSRNLEILPCVPELKKLKKCAISSKRQCSLSDICTEMVCSFVC